MADPIILSYPMVDDAGKQTSFPVYLPSSTTLAQIGTTGVGIATLLDAASGLAVLSTAYVTLPIDISGATLKGDAVADSTVRDGHNLVFAAAGTQYTHAIRLPYPIRSLVTAGALNTDAGAVADLIAAIIAGYSTDPDPTDDAGRDLTTFLRSKRSSRKVKGGV